MEGVKDGRRFRAAIEATARKKPIVVLKLGRSALGQRATLAHTGTLAGRHEAFAALFRQNGVGLVDSIDMLVEAAALFDRSPLPRGGRVVMMTVSGGATSLIGDLGEAAGLQFPPLAKATNRRIQHILGVERAFANPFDTVGLPRLRREQNLTAVLKALEQDDSVDLIGLVLGMRADGWSSHCDLSDQVAAAAKAGSKPLMIVSFMANSLTRYWRDYGRTHALPLLEDLQRGLRAVRLLIDYAAFRGRTASSQPAIMNSTPLIAQIPRAGGGILTEAESKQILAKAGLPTTREILARSPAEAVTAAARIGGRVALKVQSANIPHKSDIGGVYLGAVTPAEIETAAQRVLENARRNCPHAAIDGVLVQEMIEDGAEFLIGMTYDQQFGPLVVCGAGGIQVEVFKDVAVFLPPIDTGDVRDALGVLKAMKLLEPFRGAAAKDFDALVECCVRFGAFVSATDGVFTSIDLNPVFVRPRGQGVRIADALIEMRACSEPKHD
jgi:acetyltransferase